MRHFVTFFVFLLLCPMLACSPADAAPETPEAVTQPVPDATPEPGELLIR